MMNSRRPKASFGAPLLAWAANDLKELTGDVSAGGRTLSDLYAVQAIVASPAAGDQAGQEDSAKQTC
jgi:hypothetical protein